MFKPISLMLTVTLLVVLSCMAIFLALVYIRGLTWDFSSEVCAMTNNILDQTNHVKLAVFRVLYRCAKLMTWMEFSCR